MSRETKIPRYLRRTASGRRKAVKKHKRSLPAGVSKSVAHEVEQGIEYGEKFVYGFFDASGNIIGRPVTVIQDRMGGLHIWEGIKDAELGKGSPDRFLQFSDEIENFLGNVPQDAKESIEGGWTTFVSVTD